MRSQGHGDTSTDRSLVGFERWAVLRPTFAQRRSSCPGAPCRDAAAASNESADRSSLLPPVASRPATTTYTPRRRAENQNIDSRVVVRHAVSQCCPANRADHRPIPARCRFDKSKWCRRRSGRTRWRRADRLNRSTTIAASPVKVAAHHVAVKCSKTRRGEAALLSQAGSRFWCSSTRRRK